MFSIYLYSIKEYWWALTSSCPIRFRACFRPPMDFIKLDIDTTDDFHKLISYMTDFLFLLSYDDLFILCDVNLNSSSTRLGNALILIFLR